MYFKKKSLAAFCILLLPLFLLRAETEMKESLSSFNESVSSPKELVSGVVRVMRLIGTAKVKDNITGQLSELSSGDVLSEKYTISTGPDTILVLLFSNGSTILLKANAQVSIEKFIQEPFQSNVEYMSQIEVEPSVSNTTLKLNYGTLIGQVKRLRSDDGSTYNLDTPAGVAGIRGTIFSLTVDPNATQLDLAEGSVFFLPSIGDGTIPYISVQINQSLIVSDQSSSLGILDPNLASNIILDIQDAVSLNDVPTYYFEPNSNNGVSISQNTASPPSPEEALNPPASTGTDTNSNLKSGMSQNNLKKDIPIEIKEAPLDPTLLVPVLNPPASPIGGS